MKLGDNIHGGTLTWSTHLIRAFGRKGGGLPEFEIAVVSDIGETVTWDPNTGEVRTVVKTQILEVA